MQLFLCVVLVCEDHRSLFTFRNCDLVDLQIKDKKQLSEHQYMSAYYNTEHIYNQFSEAVNK